MIFIVGASEYDQKLYEDETQNRMREALDLFSEICNRCQTTYNPDRCSRYRAAITLV